MAEETGYLFDRKVRVLFSIVDKSVTKNYNLDETDEKKIKQNGIQVVFNPSENRDYCSRIDFIVQCKGAASDGDFFKTAEISLYNIGDTLNNILDIYGQADKEGGWNIDKRRIQVTLEVGHKDSRWVRIFTGKVGSFNIERLQSGQTVDNVWHFFCQSELAASSNVVNKTKVTSDTDIMQEAQKEAEIGLVTGEEAIKYAIMKEARNVEVLVEQDYDIAGNKISSVSENDKTILVPISRTLEITEDNFNEFFNIKYSKPELQQEWKTNKKINLNNISKDLSESLPDIAKRWGNCKIETSAEDYLNKTRFVVLVSDINDTKTVIKSHHWQIHNFENLLKTPAVSGCALELTLFMEPSMNNYDTIELLTPDSTVPSAYSFSFNFSNSTSATVFAGSNVFGAAEISQLEQDKQNMASKGNIFGTKYNITFLTHQGSTHTNEWMTIANCYYYGD